MDISYYDTSRNCEGKRYAGVISPGIDKEHIVRADQELTFRYHLININDRRYCLTNLRFNPEAGNEYVFRTESDSVSCRWLMLNTTQSDNPTPEKLNEVTLIRGFPDTWCKE